MNRTTGGAIHCQAVLYANSSKKIQGEYQKQTAKDMRLSRLRTRLCDDGPAKCADCMLCEYGKEYVIRSQHHENQRDKT